MATNFINGISWFTSLTFNITYRDGSTETIELPAPNVRNSIQFSRVYTGSPLFRDMNNRLRKGSRFERAAFTLEYSSNYIEKNKLLASDFIEVEFNGVNPPFTNTLFRFEENMIRKSWFASSPRTQDGDNFLDKNPIPDGDNSFSFLSVHLFTEDEGNNPPGWPWQFEWPYEGSPDPGLEWPFPWPPDGSPYPPVDPPDWYWPPNGDPNMPYVPVGNYLVLSRVVTDNSPEINQTNQIVSATYDENGVNDEEIDEFPSINDLPDVGEQLFIHPNGTYYRVFEDRITAYNPDHTEVNTYEYNTIASFTTPKITIATDFSIFIYEDDNSTTFIQPVRMNWDLTPHPTEMEEYVDANGIQALNCLATNNHFIVLGIRVGGGSEIISCLFRWNLIDGNFDGAHDVENPDGSPFIATTFTQYHGNSFSISMYGDGNIISVCNFTDLIAGEVTSYIVIIDPFDENMEASLVDSFSLGDDFTGNVFISTALNGEIVIASSLHDYGIKRLDPEDGSTININSYDEIMENESITSLISFDFHPAGFCIALFTFPPSSLINNWDEFDPTRLFCIDLLNDEIIWGVYGWGFQNESFNVDPTNNWIENEDYTNFPLSSGFYSGQFSNGLSFLSNGDSLMGGTLTPSSLNPSPYPSFDHPSFTSESLVINTDNIDLKRMALAEGDISIEDVEISVISNTELNDLVYNSGYEVRNVSFYDFVFGGRVEIIVKLFNKNSIETTDVFSVTNIINQNYRSDVVFNGSESRFELDPLQPHTPPIDSNVNGHVFNWDGSLDPDDIEGPQLSGNFKIKARKTGNGYDFKFWESSSEEPEEYQYNVVVNFGSGNEYFLGVQTIITANMIQENENFPDPDTIDPPVQVDRSGVPFNELSSFINFDTLTYPTDLKRIRSSKISYTNWQLFYLYFNP